MIRHKCKIAALLIVLIAFFVSSKILSIISSHGRDRKLLVRNASCYGRVLLKLLGIRVATRGKQKILSGNSRIILANHLSYIDVIAISSVLPSVFITSHEVRDLPIEGIMAHCAGSVFVDRRSTTTLRKDIRVISQLLREGFTIVLFPEATSSPGESVLPFKSALLKAALDAGCDIVPVCINYHSIDGNSITKANRDRVFYYGDMELTRHLCALLKLRTIDMELTFLPSIPSKNSARKKVASMAFESILHMYKSIQ